MKRKSLIIAFLFLQLSLCAQFTQQWVSKYNGRGDFSDEFKDMAIDKSGNLYLCGSTVRLGNNKDLLVVKLSPKGDTLWTNTYNGSGNGADEGLAITIDSLGNTFVAGYERGANGGGKNYITIKYNSLGDTVWTKVYNYSSNENEQANAIAVDHNGNVYVTGQSDSDPTTTSNDDYATVKYNANGVLQWSNRYDGAGHARDRAYKVKADAAGNVYVTGRSNNGTNDDYATIKYNSSGVQQWLKLYDGGRTDRAVDLILDPSGNIYVTGRSSNGSNPDIVTLKYNSSGTELWSSTYDRIDYDVPTGIALDGSGNVYVIGQSDADASPLYNYDYVTIKYNSSGVQSWATLYTNSSGDDIPTDLEVDKTGNVYVTGMSDIDASAILNYNYLTIKYNSQGVQQWLKSYNGSANSQDQANAMVQDAVGNVYVAGRIETVNSQMDGAVLSYSPTGSQNWLYGYSGMGDNSDQANAIATDPLGNIIVVGYSVNIGTDKDMSVVKLNSAGDTLWSKQFTGTFSGSSDEATAVGVDQSGNVYVTGYVVNSYASSDITTIKFAPNGDTLWVRKYDFIGESDRAYAMVVDAAGNVYVSGRSDSDPSINTNYDIVTIKYNSAGVQQWVARFDGVSKLDDYAVDLKQGSSGKLYLTGRSMNANNEDVVTLSYDLSGNLLWKNIYDGSKGDDRGVALAVDPSDNVFITGRTFNGADFDYFTACYGSGGVQKWMSVYNGLGQGDDKATALVLDHKGNILVTGQSDGDNSSTVVNYDYATLQYDGNGIQKWVQTFNGDADGDDIPYSIAIDDSSQVYIVGQSEQNNTGLDVVILAYSKTGTELSKIAYDNIQDTESPMASLYYKNALYVTGFTNGTTSNSDFLTLKYNFIVSEIQEQTFSSEMNIYPNPFSEVTSLELKSEEPEDFSVEMIDMSGRSYEPDFTNTGTSLKISRGNLKAGVYLLKVNSATQLYYSGKIIIN